MLELLMTGSNTTQSIVNALVFKKDTSALAHMELSSPDDRKTIFNRWPRASDRVFFEDPNDATGNAARWEFDSELDAFYHPLNTASTEMIISPYLVDNFVFESVLTSFDQDDDAMGLILGFQEDDENNSIRFLAAWVHTGGLSNPQWTLRYGDWDNAENSGHFRNMGEIVASNDQILERRTSSNNGWAGPPRFKIRIKAEKVGNTVTAWCSNFSNSDELLDESQLSVNLENLPRDGANLISDIRLGFAVNSQGDSYFLNNIIQSPTIVQDTVVYSAESNTKWIYLEDLAKWETSYSSLQDDFDSSTIINNNLTKQEFIVRDNGDIDNVSDRGIGQFSKSINLEKNSTNTFNISDILSYYDYQEPLYITDVLLVDNLTVNLFDDTIEINTNDSEGSFVVKISNLKEPELIAYRKINIIA